MARSCRVGYFVVKGSALYAITVASARLALGSAFDRKRAEACRTGGSKMDTSRGRIAILRKKKK
jgi:hypothetical protein